jgi:uncharacterized membrane protein
MNTLLRPVGKHGLQKTMIILIAFGAFFGALSYGLVHSISALSIAGMSEAQRRAVASEMIMLQLTTNGMALCGLAVGVCVASVYFLWRTGLHNEHSGFTELKHG